MGEAETSREDGPVKVAIEAIKTAAEIITPAKDQPRAGPLLVAARFYLSMIVILALASSAAAVIDFETGSQPSGTVVSLRWFLIVAVGIGMILPVVLIATLLKRHALYLFNPGELSEAQQALLPRTKETTSESGADSPGPKPTSSNLPPTVPPTSSTPPPAGTPPTSTEPPGSP